MSRTPYGHEDEVMGFGTFVIIHSGTYANVVGGSRNQSIGGTSSALSTYLVIKNATVLDSVIGGTAGYDNNYYTIYGSAFTFAYGLTMYGDSYEEKHGYGNTITINETTPLLTESSIMTGGSNNGAIVGHAHTFLGGNTSIWDVQAGGRRGTSQVDEACLEISGNALVKHVACGSITDGNSSTDWTKGYSNPNITQQMTGSVRQSKITVTDSAMVGSVFGGGYDTYEAVNYPSMLAGATISISIEGGTVGYVYGGGYRGSLGTADMPLESITIDITGGKIVRDVYGGGRGGVDKVSHLNEDGALDVPHRTDSNPPQLGIGDSTGLSQVYVNTIDINISGDGKTRPEIGGNVFGGGESTPILTGTISDSQGHSVRLDHGLSTGQANGNYGQATERNQQYGYVAKVDAGTINIRVGDCVITESVFGAGKGQYDVRATAGDEDPADTVFMKADGTLGRVPWFSGENLSRDTANDKYSGFASVETDNITISFEGYRISESTSSTGSDGVTRHGSIYGGGMYGTTAVGEQLTIRVNDSSVSENIHGGGMGVENVLGENGPGSVTARMIMIELTGTMDPDGGDDASTGTDIGLPSTSFSVFGGGKYAHVSANWAIITINGDVELWGDVYGGGMGPEVQSAEASDHECMMDANRAVILNGGKVYGSVYGGSRNGQDSEEGSFDMSVLLLISGDVSQSAFGGGYKGESYLDSRIFVGTPALEYANDMLNISPQPTGSHGLWIGSIYGGGNLGSPSQQSNALLKGNTEVEIGYQEWKPGQGDLSYGDVDGFIHIDGDVYGAGNYSPLADGKKSVVYIHDLATDGGYGIRSIQQSTEVYIVDSEISLSGSADGGQSTDTERYSFVDIGLLQIDRTRLHLYAETANIGQYISAIEGVPADRESCVKTTGGDDSTTFEGNELVIHNGRPFTLVTTDDDNTALGVGTVTGYTLLSKPQDDPYYGVYAIGGWDDTVASGFMVNDGADEANVMDTVVNGGQSDEFTIRTWYLAGHMTLGQQTTFTPGDEEQDIRLQILRMYGGSGSVFYYLGTYVDPTVQNGLRVVSEEDYGNYTESVNDRATHVYATITPDGKGNPAFSVTSHTGLNPESDGSFDEWQRHFQGDPVRIGESNTATLTTNLLYNANTGYIGSVGIVGTYVIHVAECFTATVGDKSTIIPVNMIDVVVTVHVRPVLNDPMTIDVTLMVTPTGTSNRYSGRGHIVLPAVSENYLGVTYRMVGTYDGIDVPDKWPEVPTFSGNETLRLWSDSSYLGQNGWTAVRYYEDSPYTYGQTGGVFGDDDYLGEGGIRDTALAFEYEGDEKGFIIVLNDGTRNYIITVHIQIEEDVRLTIVAETIGETQTKYYLTATGDGTSEDPFDFRWTTDINEAGFDLPYSTVIEHDTFHYKIDGGDTREPATIWEILNEMVAMDPFGTGQDFDYPTYLNDLFVDSNLMTRYNRGSELCENLTLYAGFGLTVTFHGEGVTVRPQNYIVRPGQSLDQIFNNLDVAMELISNGQDVPATSGSGNTGRINVWDGTMLAGHTLRNFGTVEDPLYSWAVRDTTGYTAYAMSAGVFTNLDLYLVWDPEVYEVTLTVNGIGGDDISIEGAVVEVTWASNVATFEAEYGSTVTIQIDKEDTIFSSGTVTLTGGSDLGILRGLGTDTAMFDVPVSSDKKVLVELTAESGYSLHVQYDRVGGDSIAVGDSIVITYKPDQGDSIAATITTSQLTAVFPVSAGVGFTLTLEYITSGSTSGNQMWYSVLYYTGNHEIPEYRDYADEMDDDIRGKLSGTIRRDNPNADVHMKFTTHWMTTIGTIGKGIASVSIEYNDATTNLSENARVFGGEVLMVTAGDGYYLPPTFYEGVDLLSGGTSKSMEFRVQGLMPVVLDDLRASARNVSVTVTLKDGSDTVDYDGHLRIVATLGTFRLSDDILFTDGVGTVTLTDIPYDGNGYMVTLAATGFENVTTSTIHPGADSSDPDVPVPTVNGNADLVLIHYTITYQGTDGSTLSGGTGLTDWTVLSEKDRPEYFTDPYGSTPATAMGTLPDGTRIQAWMTVVGGSVTGSMTDALTPASFGTDRTMTLRALADPVGDAVTGTAVLYVQSSHLNGTHTIGSDVFGNTTLVFQTPADPDASIVYTDGEVTISDMELGTGMFRATSGGCVLIVHVLADPAGGTS